MDCLRLFDRTEPLVTLKCAFMGATLSAFLSSLAVWQYLIATQFSYDPGGMTGNYVGYSIFSVVFLGNSWTLGEGGGEAGGEALFVVVARAIVIYGASWGPATLYFIYRSHRRASAPGS